MKNSGVEWIGEIPEDWEVTQVKNIFNIGRGRVIAQTELDEHGKYPVYSSQTKDNGCLGYINTYDFDINQLTWTTDGANAGTVFLRKGKHNCTNVCGTLQLKQTSNILLFYKYALEYLTIFNKRADTNGFKIMNNEMAKIITLLPPKSTQQRIASYLDKKCSKIEETIQNQQQVIEKLKAYKQSLITEAVTGKVKIENGKVCGEYESYKDSGVEYLDRIPSDWNIKRLRYIGKCQNGISKGGEFFGSGYPFVSYGDVYNNLVLPETVSGLIESTHEEQENYSVKAGDIFFTRTSETIEEVGFTSVCLKTIENATFAGFVIRVRPFTNEIIPDYSKYYFSSDAHRRFFVKEMNLVTRASLSQDLLKRLPVLIPSKEEQREIADYLDKKCTAIDTAIEQKQKLIVKLTEYKKSLIYECVTGKKEIS
nr:restriction endonuclease subunit S [uncultured Treponema sp.]